MELGCPPIVNPIAFDNFSSQFFHNIAQKYSKIKVMNRFSTSCRQVFDRSPKKLFSFFFFGSPRYYFHFLFRFAQEFHFLFLFRFAQKNWPHNSFISNQFLTTFHLSLGFMICYNIVVPRERKKPCAVRLESIGPKFRALVYI